MEKWNFNNLEIREVNSEIQDDVLSSLKKTTKLREGYKENSSVIYVPRYFYRFIGVMENEEDHFEYISKIDLQLRCFSSLYLKITDSFDRNIPLGLEGKLSDLWNNISLEGFIDTTYITDYLESKNIFPKLPNELLNRQVKNNFKGLLDYFVFNNKDVDKDTLKSIINYNVYWMNSYLYELFKFFDYRDVNPKILYYGDITEEESMFLILLSTLGCDVIYFNPHDGDIFRKVDKVNAFSKEVCYKKKIDIPPFPVALGDRIETTAYNAKEDLKKILYTEESLFYKPWQLSEYELTSITLKTTYEELFIWAKEPANLRDGWKAGNHKVVVPNIFTKIRGTHEDLDRYFEEIDKIKSLPNTKFYNKLPIIDYTHLEYSKLNEVWPKNSSLGFDVKKLINASWWKYKNLRLGLQYSIALSIKELCVNPVIKNVNDDEFRDFAVEIFSVLINLDNSFMELLQGFDYPQEIPKILIYNNEMNGNLSFEDCVLLTLMNELGVDIFIFNPSGYNDIEKYIYSSVYDMHNLEKMAFKLEYKKHIKKKKGFFEKIFGK